MRRIAHLSDVHLLDAQAGTRRARYRFATRFVSLGRAIDPLFRARRLASALAAAKANGADHVVISGDLTEVGEDSEFEHLAEILHNARLPADSVTLVPGNHDAYTESGAWKKAMRGPLAHFAAASAADPGRIVERGSVALLPVDTTCFQTMAWSGGVFSSAAIAAVERRLVDPALRNKAIVLVLHHPPFHTQRLMQWVDGLRGCAQVLELLARHPRLQLLHGHLHRVLDRILTTTANAVTGVAPANAEPQAPTRLFGAPATCDGAGDAPRLRLYDVTDDGLRVAALPIQAA